MTENDDKKRVVLAYLDLMFAIERRLGLSVKDAKEKVIADLKKEMGVGNKQLNTAFQNKKNEVKNE